MPKHISKRQQAFDARKEKRKEINTALEWCVQHQKGYKAAVSAGIIPFVHQESLKRVLAKAKGLAEIEHSDLNIAAKKLLVSRATIDSRMVGEKMMYISGLIFMVDFVEL